MSQQLISRQMAQLLQADLPNINVWPDESNINRFYFVFYYQKNDPSDTYPLLFPKGDSEGMYVSGEVHLDGYPNKSPQLFLNGNLGHCHVYSHGKGLYKICFSLDRSFEWYFSGKSAESSKFNPSVTLKHYVVSCYKFLAQDDREHSVSESRLTETTTFWRKRKWNDEDLPTETMCFFDCLDRLDNNRSQDKVVDIKRITKEITGITRFPTAALNYIDYVHKDTLLTGTEVVVMPINYKKVSNRRVFSVVSVDLMRMSTYESGVRKTSLGKTFDSCFPVMIHSKYWDHRGYGKVLYDMAKKVFGRARTNPIVRVKRKVDMDDFQLYILSELFNELAIDMFHNNMFPCEEVLKAFNYLHHIMLKLNQAGNLVVNRCNEYLDRFEEGVEWRSKKNTPNLGVLMTQYLFSNKTRDYGHLIDEVLARNILWTLQSPREVYKKVVDIDTATGDFKIIDMDGWIEQTWKDTCVGKQRSAFQHEYNNRFKGYTLEHYDNGLGCIIKKDIIGFQTAVKRITSWGQLSAKEGYKKYFEFFGVTEMDLENRMRKALVRSKEMKYHDFIKNTKWKRIIKKAQEEAAVATN